MKRIAIILYLIICTHAYLSAQQSLPIIRLTGTFGSDYQSGTIEIEGQTYPMTAKWRGASTGGSEKHKHNYKIKLERDYSFFGMREDNNWILDAGQVDPFRLRNRIATDLWLEFARTPYYANERLNPLNGARGRVVELYLNGQYEGIYSFGENMDRKQMQLKKYDAQIHGLLWKAIGYEYTTMWDCSDQYDNSQPMWGSFEVKYPDFDDYHITDFEPLFQAVHFVVNSTDEEFAAHVADYFDLPVVMDYIIFVNVLGAMDNLGKNTVWAIYDSQSNDHRLTPAVWDVDLSVASPQLAYYNPDLVDPYFTVFGGINLGHRLLNLNVDNWNTRFYQRYMQLRQGVLHTDSLIKRYHDTAEWLEATGAAQREIDRWSGDSDIHGRAINFRADADSIAHWLSIHLPHLDTVLCDTAIQRYVGIREVAAKQNSHQSDAIYNLQGQRQRSDLPLRPGIYIRKGRKFIVKQ